MGFILNRANTKLKNALFQRIRGYDITPEQWSVLNCLWVQEGAIPKELADILYKDKANTNRILDKLYQKKLIVRKPHSSDKRAVEIYLTDRGRSLRDELIPIVAQLLEEATTGMTVDKVAEMKKMLNQIFDNLA